MAAPKKREIQIDDVSAERPKRFCDCCGATRKETPKAAETIAFATRRTLCCAFDIHSASGAGRLQPRRKSAFRRTHLYQGQPGRERGRAESASRNARFAHFRLAHGV